MEGNILFNTFMAGMAVSFLISTLGAVLASAIVRDEKKALELIQGSLGAVTIFWFAEIVLSLIMQ